MAAKKKTGGRQKGTPNKTTAAVKEAMVQAFDQLGGVPALVEWAKSNPTDFYKLWAKLLPTEIKNADGEAFKVQTVTEVIVTSREEARAVLALNGDTDVLSAPVPGPA